VEASLAFEPGSGQLLLFGGQTETENTNQTFSWNGTTWTTLAPAVSPSGGFGAPLAYDPATAKLLLFADGTWLWNGVSWINAAPAQSPSSRNDTAMAYDAATGQMVLFGGETGLFNFVNDTWTWNGTTWNELSPAHAPSTRKGAAMAYDAATHQLILFGGYHVNGGVPTALGDTWEWTGTDWKELTPPTSPSVRVSASIAYDAAAERLILFGGYTQTGVAPNDTWAWNGTTWEQLTPPTSPPARAAASMAYDAKTEQVTLFGGSSENDFGDTWVFGLPIPPTEPPANPTGSSTPPASGSATPPVSAAPAAARCKVPNLKGKTLKAAKKKIRAAGCKVGTVKKVGAASASTGRVKSQGPKPGRVLAPGAKVNVKLG
jgi:hypothetical protein